MNSAHSMIGGKLLTHLADDRKNTKYTVFDFEKHKIKSGPCNWLHVEDHTSLIWLSHLQVEEGLRIFAHPYPSPQ
jgi:hypothetical protein